MKEDTINRNNISKHLVEYELEMIGKTLANTIDDIMWRFNFTMTRNQFEQFRLYAIPLLKKTFKFNKRKAEETFKWFYDNFGVRIKN